MVNPIWIIVDDGDTFEGTQLHWADCFFSNAFRREIETFLDRMGWKYEIREMTDEEVARYPDNAELVKQLMEEYGEV